MIIIPEELLEQIERGNVLLFIGERIVRDAEGGGVLDQLTAQLADRCKIADTEDLAFPEAAQAYEDDKGRHTLVQFLRDQLEMLGDEPQQVHHLIASLTDYCNVLITTCLNRRLERAFKAAGRPLDTVIGNVDVAFEDEHKARLYKLRGSLDRVESLILTEDDHEAFFRNRANLSIVLQGYLARKTILFIGYDLADPLFKRLYCEVTAPLDDYARRAFAFGESPSPRVQRWCERHGIEVVPADATAFLEELGAQLAARARPAPIEPKPPQEKPVAPPPERPYKLLDYYEAKDAAIFFGRGQETQTLTSLIHAHRLVLLYGASGVGKTSLLLAGAAPRLESAEPPYETIHVRALEDPALVIRRTVRRRLPEADLPQDGSLVDFLDAATRATDHTLVIVLDQFEEFFIRLSPEFRAAFIAELGALYDARDVPIKVVLSLREDWLAPVSEIEERIPEVFRTKTRLLPLTRDQARQAITAPVERLGISYEPALVEQLLDDLTGTESAAVMPPQLQLVCNALYERACAEGRQSITMADYEALGSARGVLQKYLDDELARLRSDERALARGVLEELITSQGTKAVKASDELALALDAKLPDVEPVLEKLVRARLLRALEREDGGIAYELAHEYLIREIGLGPEAQKRKQAEELIKQEVENWRRFGTLLAADKLALISEVREMLRLNAEAQELLLRSALVQARLTLFYRALAGGFGAAAGVALAAALVTYIIWQPNSEVFHGLPLPLSVAALGLMGGAVGLVQGAGASLSLTLADMLVKKPRIYFRLLGGMVGGGISLGITFALLRLGWAWSPIEVSYGEIFVLGLIIGALASGGAALAIPEIGMRRSLFKQAVFGAIAAGGIIVLIEVLRDTLLSVVLTYSALEGMFGGGMALGLGILDRLPHITQNQERSRLSYE